jgi:hypothetical protein
MPCIHIRADQRQAFAVPYHSVGSMGPGIEPSQKSIIYGLIGKSDPLIPAGSNMNAHPMAACAKPQVGLLRCRTPWDDVPSAAVSRLNGVLKTRQDA